MDNFLQIFLAITGGGGLGFFLNYLISKRQTDQSEFEILLKVWKEERLELKAERFDLLARERENSKKIKELTEELTKLKSKMMLLESAHFDLPLAQCVKDLDGTFLLINNEFDRMFVKPHGKKSSDCIGSDGVEIWGEKLMSEYREAEIEVIETKTPKHYTENGFDLNRKPTKWSTFRWPIYLGDKTIATGLLVLDRFVENPTMGMRNEN
jgi:hypothetical protein